MSNLFRNPLKFKIMENKYETETADKIKQFHADIEKEAGDKVKQFNAAHKFKKKPALCFFLEPKDLAILLGVPNFQGISIYNGVDDKGDEVLILVPAIRGSDLKNVYSLTYSANDSATTTTTSTVVELKPGPCPPNPPNCRNCTCT
jgi:hypothetical protein